MKDPVVVKDSIKNERTACPEQQVIEQAVKMYDSRKYSLLEILEATGLSKSTLFPFIQNRN